MPSMKIGEDLGQEHVSLLHSQDLVPWSNKLVELVMELLFNQRLGGKTLLC